MLSHSSQDQFPIGLRNIGRWNIYTQPQSQGVSANCNVTIMSTKGMKGDITLGGNTNGYQRARGDVANETSCSLHKETPLEIKHKKRGKKPNKERKIRYRLEPSYKRLAQLGLECALRAHNFLDIS